MNRHREEETPLELERYELFAGPIYHFCLERRDFLKILGAGVLISAALPPLLRAQERGGGFWSGGSGASALDSRIHIAKDGLVTVMTGKVEIGQGIRTALAQAAAEELRISPTRIRMLMGDTALVPDDGPTFGSMTIPRTLPVIRQGAAAAREYLIDLAAARWKTNRATLQAREGKVEDPRTGRSLGYGELVRGEMMTRKIGEIALPPATQWQVLGKPLPRVEGVDIVTGNYKYPSDVRRKDMLYGKILRPPTSGARLVSVDTAAASALAGVTVVKDGDFVGVTAPSAERAKIAIEAVKATWSTPPRTNHREIYGYLKTRRPSGGRQSWRGLRNLEEGSVEEGLARSVHKLQATYTVAYIAHAPLEPRAAVAEWKDGKLTVWTGTQIPFWVRREVAAACRVPEERVRVIMSSVGSAFGGKHTGDAAVEAAKLSQKVGKPVQVFWTREEEFTGGYFRPAGVIEVTGGVAADGSLMAWELHNYNSGAEGLNSPWYAAADVRTAFHASDSPLHQGSYRALAATANHFARESHLDDLAALAGLDPLSFRLKNLKDARLRAVLEATAEKFGWAQRKRSPTWGSGLACGFDKGGYVACCAEVEVRGQTMRVIRLTEGFDCGAVVNPALLRSQMIGAIIQGLGGALFEEIRFENGKILNPRFSSYRLPRLSDVPRLEAFFMDRQDIPPAGAGETPIVPVAPAIRNAVFAATGVQLRTLPLRLPA